MHVIQVRDHHFITLPQSRDHDSYAQKVRRGASQINALSGTLLPMHLSPTI